jgi:hypothetical protein
MLYKDQYYKFMKKIAINYHHENKTNITHYNIKSIIN